MREDNIVLLSYSLSVEHDLDSNKQLKSFIDISLKNKFVVRWILAHTSIRKWQGRQIDQARQQNAATNKWANILQEVKSIIKQEHVKLWRNIHYYTRASDATNKLERRSPTTIFLLWTCQCGLHQHMTRMGLAETANCPLYAIFYSWNILFCKDFIF